MLEAHGTGTSAGDPIEASAAAKIFGPHRNAADPLYVGAIKSGIGHLEGGAGVAGVIKSVLILESGIIPPNVNFEKPNPKVPVKRWNLKFPLENTPWPTSGTRRISVNSFGVGGTNAHVILDDAFSHLASNNISGNHNTVESVPTHQDIHNRLTQLEQLQVIDQPKINGTDSENKLENGHIVNGSLQVNGDRKLNGTEPEPKNRVFAFSAFDEHGIRRNATRLADYLQKRGSLNSSTESEFLDRLAFTLSEKRSNFPWKSFLVAKSIQDLSDKLTSDDSLTIIRAGNKPRIGYVFTGQGAQWYKMGRELLEYPVYRRSMEEASGFGSEPPPAAVTGCWTHLALCKLAAAMHACLSRRASKAATLRIKPSIEIQLGTLARGWGHGCSAGGSGSVWSGLGWAAAGEGRERRGQRDCACAAGAHRVAQSLCLQVARQAARAG